MLYSVCFVAFGRCVCIVITGSLDCNVKEMYYFFHGDLLFWVYFFKVM
jgi:hypothetical protein